MGFVQDELEISFIVELELENLRTKRPASDSACDIPVLEEEFYKSFGILSSRVGSSPNKGKLVFFSQRSSIRLRNANRWFLPWP